MVCPSYRESTRYQWVGKQHGRKRQREVCLDDVSFGNWMMETGAGGKRSKTQRTVWGLDTGERIHTSSNRTGKETWNQDNKNEVCGAQCSEHLGLSLWIYSSLKMRPQYYTLVYSAYAFSFNRYRDTIVDFQAITFYTPNFSFVYVWVCVRIQCGPVGVWWSETIWRGSFSSPMWVLEFKLGLWCLFPWRHLRGSCYDAQQCALWTLTLLQNSSP